MYTNHTQQDAFLFFIELRNSWPNRINELFTFTIHTRRRCSNCSNIISYGERDAKHISISLSERSTETDFYSKFQSKTIGHCTYCNTESQQHYSEQYHISDQCKYLVIYTSLFSWCQQGSNGSIKINSKLIGYDPDNIMLPSTNNTPTMFKIMSVIVRTGQTQNYGHYTIWVRHLRENTWLHIDDLTGTQCTQQLNSGEFIKDIQFIFLQKK
jgi:uncharacterized UBP type Zn finger protein